jgi:DNA-binding transcriptional regulator GbsR (MarR family)
MIKMNNKENEVFRTWEKICLDKLREIGKASLTKWATVMDYKNASNMSKTVRNLERQGKIRVIYPKGERIKKYYEAI